MKDCPKCGIEHDKSGIFCSRTCANSRGPRTDDFKEKVRSKLSGRRLSEEHIKNISGDNHHTRRNKKLPSLEKECLQCGKLHKNKQFCSQKCWMDFNKSIRNEWEQYAIDCKFKFNVYDYPDLFDLSLIDKHGWYRASNRGNNLNGVSRDHRYSVKQGFINNIDPEIISHPVNCSLILHTENQSKREKCSITLEQLYEEIDRRDMLIYGSVPER